MDKNDKQADFSFHKTASFYCAPQLVWLTNQDFSRKRESVWMEWPVVLIQRFWIAVGLT